MVLTTLVLARSITTTEKKHMSGCRCETQSVPPSRTNPRVRYPKVMGESQSLEAVSESRPRAVAKGVGMAVAKEEVTAVEADAGNLGSVGVKCRFCAKRWRSCSINCSGKKALQPFISRQKDERAADSAELWSTRSARSKSRRCLGGKCVMSRKGDRGPRTRPRKGIDICTVSRPTGRCHQ
jgi:hypothetical protein